MYQINEKILFNGKSNFLKLPQNNIFKLENKNFLISMVVCRTNVNPKSSLLPMYLLDSRNSESFGINMWYDCNLSKLKICNGNVVLLQSKAGIPLNEDIHIEIKRYNNYIQMKLNNVISNDKIYDDSYYTNNILFLGTRYQSMNDNSLSWYGSISDFKLYKF